MLVQTMRNFLEDQSGATAIEYALLATLIAIGLVATLAIIGNSVENLFDSGAAETIQAQTNKI